MRYICNIKSYNYDGVYVLSMFRLTRILTHCSYSNLERDYCSLASIHSQVNNNKNNNKKNLINFCQFKLTYMHVNIILLKNSLLF